MICQLTGGIMDTKDNKKVNILVTGGAGFMGRWVSKNLAERGNRVWILDNLTNGSDVNIEEFKDQIAEFSIGDIKDKALLSMLFKNKFDICIHLAAAINVQESIDNPQKCFNNNVVGVFNVLEECRLHGTKIVFMSSALVYDTARDSQAITEEHPLNSSCPYAASKIFGEKMVIAYYKTYNLPVVILRPFTIYGPWQRSDSEGGVMSIFIDRKLKSEPIEVFGNGEQSRDFFYIEDCAEYIVKASFSEYAVGQIFNAGSGKEVKIKDLASKIAGNAARVKFIEHHHPHAEIMNMRADSTKARKLLGWENTISFEEGIKRTTDWLKMREAYE